MLFSSISEEDAPEAEDHAPPHLEEEDYIRAEDQVEDHARSIYIVLGLNTQLRIKGKPYQLDFHYCEFLYEQQDRKDHVGVYE